MNSYYFKEKFARSALFVVYFWFGILKVIGASPASHMVLALLEKTMPFITPEKFLILFGGFEMLIGLLFLSSRFTKIALGLVALHLLAVVLPLVLLPEMTWQGFLVPTLEGQYIIKNILIVALCLGFL